MKETDRILIATLIVIGYIAYIIAKNKIQKKRRKENGKKLQKKRRNEQHTTI